MFRFRWVVVLVGVLTLFLAATAVTSRVAVASPGRLQEISSDPYTNVSSQHQTEVEPDTFAFGNTIVAAFQAGRFTDGGASNIGWATSTNGGRNWTSGFLPSLTAFSSPAGPFDRASDPSVAYDDMHGVWLINSLALDEAVSLFDTGLVVSRSTDGVNWGAPVTVSPQTGSRSHDKNWIVCDNGTSSFRGNCYVSWSSLPSGTVVTSTSTDGGLTWGPPVASADNADGFGVQPVVQPDGTLVVVFISGFDVLAIRSTDGGTTFSTTVTVDNNLQFHQPSQMRAVPYPSVEVDGGGRVYAVWHDCSFRTNCSANDMVMSTSTDGVAWSAKTRIPIDPVTSGVDHFIPGLAVDPSTQGANARLALAYYFFSEATCIFSTCELNVGFISSGDGGSSWSKAKRLSRRAMSQSWIADTTSGRMVGDYISTSFVNGGRAVPVFALASAPDGSFHESMYAEVIKLPGKP